MSTSIRMTASVSVDACTPVSGRLFVPSEHRGASALLTIGDVGQVLSVHIDAPEQLVELAAILTEVHREWTALVDDREPYHGTGDEIEDGGQPPPW